MLRVGLTGELGSGKSTVARLLAEHGAVVLSSDEMARAMMQPGYPVYQAIVDHFGPTVLLPQGQLNRPELTRLAFDPEHPRIEELNSIVHPAVLAEQERQTLELARTHPDSIVVIESALIFSAVKASGGEPWRIRFDRIVVVMASEELQIARFVRRSAHSRPLSDQEQNDLVRDARQRIAAQRISPESLDACLILHNDGNLEELRQKVSELWLVLRSAPSLHS